MSQRPLYKNFPPAIVMFDRWPWPSNLPNTVLIWTSVPNV